MEMQFFFVMLISREELVDMMVRTDSPLTGDEEISSSSGNKCDQRMRFWRDRTIGGIAVKTNGLHAVLAGRCSFLTGRVVERLNTGEARSSGRSQLGVTVLKSRKKTKIV